MHFSVLTTMVREKFNAPDNFLKTKRKMQEIVWPRHVIRYLLREHFGLSHRVCAQIAGGADHSTNVHSVNVIKTEIYRQTEIGKQVDVLVASIKAITDKENNPNGFGFPTLEW